VAAVAALAVVVAAVAFCRGDEEPPAVAAPTTSSLAGLQQDGISVGDPDAPATLVEFADLQCPFCGVYGREVLPTALDRYVRSGKLRLELHVLTFLGEDSVRAGQVAAGAASQDRLWSFAEAFYARQGEENSGYVTDAFLRSATAAAGVDLAAAQHDPDAVGVLARAQAEADRLGVKGTPAFFLRRGDSGLEPAEFGDMTSASFSAALDEALAAR
jgi:protein-disulfide isomerase